MLFRSVKSADKLSAKDGEALLDYLKAPCETTTLVFTAAKLDKRLKFSKELLERAIHIDCAALPESRLPEWIRQESARAGVPLNAEAAGALSQLALSLKGKISQLNNYGTTINTLGVRLDAMQTTLDRMNALTTETKIGRAHV